MTDELKIGQEVWFQINYCEDPRKGSEVRYQQCFITDIGEAAVGVRWYSSPTTETRRVLQVDRVLRSCPRDPLFSF